MNSKWHSNEGCDDLFYRSVAPSIHNRLSKCRLWMACSALVILMIIGMASGADSDPGASSVALGVQDSGVTVDTGLFINKATDGNQISSPDQMSPAPTSGGEVPDGNADLVRPVSAVPGGYGSPVATSAVNELGLPARAWYWLGGYITSDPSIIIDRKNVDYIFALGGDRSLWVNIDGNWSSLGGYLTSEVYAINDAKGHIHIFSRGGDNALWDCIFNINTRNGEWRSLGGYITSNPSAAQIQNGSIMITARGGDNQTWIRELKTSDYSGSWRYLGTVITSDPQSICDGQGRIHTFARGADGSLRDNIGTLSGGVYQNSWINLGGYITSNARPSFGITNSSNVYTFARGGNGGLWVNTLNLNSLSGGWTGLGGFIAPAGDGSNIYGANPAPINYFSRYIRVFIRGGDGSLWYNLFDTNSAQGSWHPLAGYLTSDVNAASTVINSSWATARGGDNALWVNA